MLSADLIASLNTISSHRGNPKVNYYVFVGYSIAATQISGGKRSIGFFKYKGTVYNGSNLNLPNLYKAEGISL